VEQKEKGVANTDTDNLRICIHFPTESSKGKTKCVAAFQYPKNLESFTDEQSAKDLIKKISIHNVDKDKIIQTFPLIKNTDYFLQFSDAAILDSAPWNLIRVQGENKMWFTSAFASFDKTYSILKYNYKI